MKKNLFLMTISLSLLSLVLTAQVKTSAKTGTGVKTSTVAKKPTNSNSKYGTFKDPRDGHIYKTVRIGSQVWMAENLAYGQPTTLKAPCKNYNVLYKSKENIRDDGYYTRYKYDIYACGEFKYTCTIEGTGHIYESDSYYFKMPWVTKKEFSIMKFDRGYYLSKGNYTTSITDAIAYYVKKYLDEQPAEQTTPGISVYNNDYNNGRIYGFLYTWEAAKAACPSGWHLPTKEEFEILINYLGGVDVAGGKLKMTGTTYWNDPNKDATNSSGFTGLPGGYLYYDGTFSSIGFRGIWWSASEKNATDALCYIMGDNYSAFYSEPKDKVDGLSVRYVRD